MAQATQKFETQTTSPVEYRIAATKAERDAIFKLRYEIYVEEMHREQPYANHKTRTIEEPQDSTAIILGVWDNGELVGTIRANMSSDSKFEFREIYNFSTFEAQYPGQVALITKLMIKKDRRGGRIALNIFRETYKILREEGAEVLLIDANDHLLNTYRRLGFVAIKEKCAHPLYGMVTPMAMTMKDQAQFEAVKSPLADLCRVFNEAEIAHSVHHNGSIGFWENYSYGALAPVAV